MNAGAPASGVEPVPSPCVNVCRMNATTGWCEGCLRTLGEITVWSRLSGAQRRLVWQQLEQRRALQPPPSP